MRSNTVLWWIISVFFLLLSALYTGWNILEHQDRPLVTAIEWVGTTTLLFVAFMGGMIAFYLHRVHAAQGGELPEDVLTSDIDDGDPELGEFSPWSWWPMILAGSAALFMIGLAVGHFLLPVGIAAFIIAIIGWVYEYYRGHFAR